MMKNLIQKRGVALIIVLAFVAILSLLLVIFMTVVGFDRTVSSNYAEVVKADQIARGGLDIAVDDLEKELQAGSQQITVTGTGANFTFYIPNGPQTMLPARIGVSPAISSTCALIRRSDGNPADWALAFSGTAYNAGILPPNRASLSNSATSSATRKTVSLRRWNQSYLLPSTANSTTFTAPDWILMTRSGAMSVSGSSGSLASLGNSVSNNPNYVLGRFSYLVYDEGALLDMNMAGYPADKIATTGTAPSSKGPLPWADISQIPGVTNTGTNTIVHWRNAASASSSSSYINYVYTSNTSGFTYPARGDDRFLGRRDLIDYALANPSETSTTALQYLGTFSRELNEPASISTTATNSLAATVVNGHPLTRFPLDRLALLASTTNAALIKQYFGLTIDASSTGNYKKWNYTATGSMGTPQVILNMKQVNAQGRDPNFFEYLLAAIAGPNFQWSMASGTNASSLGAALAGGSNNFANTTAMDENPYYQVIRIGLNIIDQYFANDFPTTIQFDNYEFYGTKDLPYINKVFMYSYFPEGSGTGEPFYPMLAVQWWNPHLPPATALPSTMRPEAVRVYMSGSAAFYDRPQDNGEDPASGPSWSLDPPRYMGMGFSPSIPVNQYSKTAWREPQITAIQPPMSMSSPGAPPVPYTIDGFPLASGTVFGVPPPANAPFTYNGEMQWTIEDVVPVMQWQDPATQTWHNYGTFCGMVNGDSMISGTVPDISGSTGINLGDNWSALYFAPFFSPGEGNTYINNVTAPMYSPLDGFSFVKSDPRTGRLGVGYANSLWDNIHSNYPPDPALVNSAIETNAPTSFPGFPSTSYYPINYNTGGSEVVPAARGSGPPTMDGVDHYLALFAINVSGSGAYNYYQDPDGSVRVGDGYLNVDPMQITSAPPYSTVPVTQTTAPARPIILHRPFQTVGELGYVFRDDPWRTLDLFSSTSADGNLLEMFTPVTETGTNCGKVDVNLALAPVVQAILAGATTQEEASPRVVLSSSAAAQIAQDLAMVNSNPAGITSTNAFLSKASLLNPIWPYPASTQTSGTGAYSPYKTQREAVIRALGDCGTTRTWNLLIDIVAQSGHYPVNPASLDQFAVQGERRYWLHVAIDRLTGQIIDQQLELVNE